jgi:hypothetical protein
MMARAGRMRMVLLALALALGAGAGTAMAEPARGKAAAAKKSAGVARRARPVQPRRPAAQRVETTSVAVAEGREPEAAPPAPSAGARPAKPRVYTFGGLDVEGKLKAPQLLYFRSRMRQELDTSNSESRSFLKELEKTADEKGL